MPQLRPSRILREIRAGQNSTVIKLNMSDPRIVVAVMVDEPSKGVFYGGDVAAPVFSEVVQQTLRMMGVPTDIEVKPQIVFQPGAAEVESF